MKKLRNILSEIFNSHYPYTKRDDEFGSTGTFKTEGGDYTININHSIYGNNAGLSFKDKNNHYDVYGITGKENFSSHKIIGTVKHFAHTHLKANPHIENIMFSSDEKEPTRTKLYHTLAQSIDKNYKSWHKPKFGTRFTLKNPYHTSE